MRSPIFASGCSVRRCRVGRSVVWPPRPRRPCSPAWQLARCCARAGPGGPCGWSPRSAGPGQVRATTSEADRASVRSALVRVTEAMVAGEVAAFVTAATVAERLEALQAARPRRASARWRALLYGPAAALLTVAVASAAGLLEHVTVVHLLAGLCSLH